MLIELDRDVREELEALVQRRARPTKRQKAQALLYLSSGKSPERVSEWVGITKDEVITLATQFREAGLEGVGLRTARRGVPEQRQHRKYPTIEKSPGVCNGAARVRGTRIPVWQLIEARAMGVSEAQILLDFPRLKAVNLADAWAYAADHADEIDAAIRANEVA